MSGLAFKIWELVCYCLIAILGLAGNSLVCLVVLKNGPVFRRAPFNILIMSLAIADILLSLVAIPFYLLLTAIIPHPDGIAGTVLCKVSHTVPFWLAGVSIYLLVAISFERYEAVKDPLAAYTRSGFTKRTRFFISGAWLIGFVIQLPTVIGIKYDNTDAKVGNCVYILSKNTRKIIYPFTFFAQFVIPALIFIVNFIRIYKCMSMIGSNLRSHFSGDVPKKILQRKRRTVKVIFTASLAFFICWTPNNTMYFLFQYFNKVAWNSDLYQIGVVLGFLNSCINPFLYAFQSADFRENCLKILRKATRGKAVGSSFTGSTSNGFFSDGYADTKKLITYPS